MTEWLDDVRWALRSALVNRGSTCAVVVTLALAIGANSLVFSLVYAALMRPLPFRDSARLVEIWRRPPGSQVKAAVALANIEAFRRLHAVFEGVVPTQIRGTTITEGDGALEAATLIWTDTELFRTLGVRPLLGRGFEPQDYRHEQGALGVVIIGHDLWQRRFAGDPAVVGRRIELDLYPRLVVGVMPSGFRLFRESRAEIYIPIPHAYVGPEASVAAWDVIARLRPRVTVAQAQAALTAVAQGLERDGLATQSGSAYRVEPLHEFLFGRRRTAVLGLLLTVGLILLVACANVANLMLARAARNQHELAVRQALGAGRGQLLRRAFVDGLVLSLLGAGVGVLAAAGALPALNRFLVDTNTGLPDAEIGVPVLAFTALVSLVATLLFAVLPALRTSAIDLRSSLGVGPAAQGGRRRRLNELLIVAEAALSLVLLAGAGLLVKSTVRLLRTDLGFAPGRVLATSFTFHKWEREFGSEFLRRWPREVLERVRGAEAAALSSDLPVSTGPDPTTHRIVQLSVRGTALPAPGYVDAHVQYVSGDYFRVLGIPLKRGRSFAEAEATPVAVVNESFARQIWGAADPAGARLQLASLRAAPLVVEVVGVVGDVKLFGARAPMPACQVYLDAAQSFYSFHAYMLVRSSVPAATFAPLIRQEMAALDSRLRTSSVRPLRSWVDDSTLQDRTAASVMAAFALIALVLTAVGIYGVVSYVVSQRTAEVGIRMALGATRHAILALVLGHGIRLALLGSGIGILLAGAIARVLSSVLFGVAAHDVATFAASCALLLLVAAAATYLPARRAMRLEPVAALRRE